MCVLFCCFVFANYMKMCDYFATLYEYILKGMICIKRLLACITAFLLLSGVASAQDIRIKYNDSYLTLFSPPQKVGEYIMLPMRNFFESIGFTVGWDESTKSVIASGKGSQKVLLRIGETKITVNNKIKTLDIPPMIISDVTYVPVSLIIETLSCNVKYENNNQTITIIDSNNPIGYTTYPGTSIICYGELFPDSQVLAYGIDGNNLYYTYSTTSDDFSKYIQIMEDYGWRNTKSISQDNQKTDIFEKDKKTLSIVSGISTFNSTFMYNVKLIFVK